jgi:hypothetical protein
MKPRKLYIELPINRPELTEQSKAEYRNQDPWKYEQVNNGRFLDRDRVLRGSTRQVREPELNGLISDAVAGVLLVITLILIYLIGYVIFA